tara:strand:- start:10116 stop:11108 length:993 start_codon:yes stop_codon:yes gene_type:complete
MKKNIFKKIFIKFCKLVGYEIIDQNEYYSPSLKKNLNENLSNLDKSIVIPLGEVKIIKKIRNLSIMFRTNSNIDIWDQNKKRIFEKPKIEYVLRALNSVIKSIAKLKEKKPDFTVKFYIIDDNSTEKNLNKIQNLLGNVNFEYNIINHNNEIHKNIIIDKNKETYSNLSSLLKCFEIAKENENDLFYFLEDDYIHFDYSLLNMIDTFERISSQLKKDVIICPSDYPFNYMNIEKSNILIGSNQHWRTITKILCTFMITKKMFNQNWELFKKTCLTRNDPFEKYINKILESEVGISPIKSLAIHMTNVNSSYGLSPFIDIKKLWDENKTDL